MPFAARQGFFGADTATRIPKVLTCAGSASISTAEYEFGGASGRVGIGDANLNDIYAAYNSTNISQLANVNQWTNWTAEYWVNYVNLTSPDDGGYPATMGSMERNDYPFNWSLGADRNGALVFAYVNNSNSYIIEKSANSYITTATWYQIAAVKQSSSIKCYLNGVELVSFTISGTFAQSNRPFSLGSYYRIGANCYIDEVRISKTARYTTNFTPATTEFVNDADTLLLLHLNGTNGSTTIVDDNT